MSRKSALPRQSTITKAIKGTLKAGAKVSRVEVRPDGSFTIFNDDSAVEPDDPNVNEWDTVVK